MKVVNDIKYWEKYYSKKNTPFAPSRFAEYVRKHYVNKNDSMIELGCGNAVYFASEGIDVLAYDQCEKEIDFLSKNYPLTGLEFKADDFTKLSTKLKCSIVYSRFTLHSVPYSGQAAVISWINNVLLEGGYFLLEVRGKKNELFKKGVAVPNEQDAYIYNDHYRRFLDFSDTCVMLETAGLKIVEASEEKGFSPFNGDDETFIRIVTQKI